MQYITCEIAGYFDGMAHWNETDTEKSGFVEN